MKKMILCETGKEGKQIIRRGRQLPLETWGKPGRIIFFLPPPKKGK
jgi:hypothetical protein